MNFVVFREIKHRATGIKKSQRAWRTYVRLGEVQAPDAPAAGVKAVGSLWPHGRSTIIVVEADDVGRVAFYTHAKVMDTWVK